MKLRPAEVSTRLKAERHALLDSTRSRSAVNAGEHTDARSFCEAFVPIPLDSFDLDKAKGIVMTIDEAHKASTAGAEGGGGVAAAHSVESDEFFDAEDQVGTSFDANAFTNSIDSSAVDTKESDANEGKASHP